MVSPCLDSRLNNNANCFPKSAAPRIPDSSGNESVPPTGFQFSAVKTDDCVHPKHLAKRRTSDARLLGNIRSLIQAQGTTDGVAFIRYKEAEPSASREQEKVTKRRKAVKEGDSSSNDYSRKEAKSNVRRVSFEETRRGSSEYNDLHFAAKSENARRRQMATALNAMLGGAPKARRSSLKFQMANDFQQQAPDARNDPYRVHKWRQRSSRKKLAGMQGTPSADKDTLPENDFRTDNRPKKIRKKDGSVPEEQNFVSGDFPRKPRVPLPGVNLLPALYVSDRSDAGMHSHVHDEVTLSFARNAAMEELERRFHDDSWKTKRQQRRSKAAESFGGKESQSLLGEYRETRRSKFLRKAASMHLAPHDVEGNQRPSVMHTMEDLLESPAKLTPDKQFGTETLTPTTRGDDAMPSTHAPLTDAMKYKMISDSLSEETVTIVSKSSNALSPTKNSIPTLSGNSLAINHGNEAAEFGTEQKQKTLEHVAPSQPTQRKQERRFPILPEFPQSSNVSNADSTILNQLQQTMQRANEQQYQQYSRRKASLECDMTSKPPSLKPRERRVILPPINSKNIQGQTTLTKGKTKQRRSKVVQEDIGMDMERHMELTDSLSPLGSSPMSYKKNLASSKTSPLSHVSATTLNKDSSTPVDSVSSKSTGRRRSNKWRRRSLRRTDSKGSPQFQRAQKQTKVAKLMGKWRAAIRLSIMFGRLCSDHHMVSDDSYNIHFERTKGEKRTGGTKPEVLFDVTDYKTKNQLRLSETIRRILSTATEERSDQDIRMAQTSLRNIKAVSDHSSSVQENIARLGCFAGFGSKRVVVLENRRPLNYYILLAGSAVVIKSDEQGNTSPAWFMKRGDVFGEREILDDRCWEWSVVTVEPCEFLLVDRQDYIRIFLAGGSGGLLSDPDRGTFLKSLSLFQGWPTQLLESNPNRCLFRYYKRGALLAKDNTESDWIYVVKSGSCSVLKPLKVKELTPKEIYHKQMEEQTAKLPPHLLSNRTEKQEAIDQEEHMKRIDQIEDNWKADQMSISSHKQIEMAAILKELNIEMKDGLLTPVDEEDESEETEESETTDAETVNQKTVTIEVTEGDLEPYNAAQQNETEFRLSRVSERAGPPRTPSPMKAAYLQTGISSDRHEASRRPRDVFEMIVTSEPEAEETSEMEKFEADSADKPLATTIENMSDYLSKLDSSPDLVESVQQRDKSKLKPVYVSVRKLTKGSTFGLGPVLFNDQPSLALISNGAECLMLNKKFYLDNMTDEVLQNLREAEHPYPSEGELHESYWRLISWKAFQQRTVRRLYQHRAKIRQYMNPPRADVY